MASIPRSSTTSPAARSTGSVWRLRTGRALKGAASSRWPSGSYPLGSTSVARRPTGIGRKTLGRIPGRSDRF
jgi:hypothetical protein